MKFNQADGYRQVGPGIFQKGETRKYVVDVTIAAPVYLEAIGEQPSITTMEVVRMLIKDDIVMLAGPGKQIGIHYPNLEGAQAFADKNLQDDSEKRTRALLDLNSYRRRLSERRIANIMKAKRVIEV